MGNKGEERTKEHESWTETLSEISHKVEIGGVEIAYTATAGTMVLRQEQAAQEGEGEVHQPKATLFFVAYNREGAADPAKRPISFAFNGGPGSSSVWLHMGLLGPRRVLMDDEGFPTAPPYRLEDNAESLLDVSDLVFIDPVTTGYSRAVPGEKPEQFHDFGKDIELVGEFIRLYTTRFRRWSSPKFLAGESYGTTRAAALAGYLQRRHGFYLNGIVLISCVLDFQSARFDVGNDLPFVLFLPTYTATAWYHGRLGPELQGDLNRALQEAEEFATGDYVLALLKGSSIADLERRETVARLARLTGLTETYVEQTNLRINIHRFAKELMRSERRTVGRLDSRFVGRDRDAAGERAEFDPSYAAIQGPYTAGLNDYVRRELGFQTDLPYEILTDRVQPWRYEEHQNQYVNVAETLRQAMSQNAHLRVFVANGYYDLATPYLATRYTFDHLQLEPELRGNIQMAYYEAGHMMYIRRASLAKLKADLAGFVQGAAPS